MKLADVVEQMKAVLTAGESLQPWQRSEHILALAGDFLVKAIGRDEANGQVAILMLTGEQGPLVFAFPKHLVEGNKVPLDRNSIAGKVVLDGGPVVENNMPNEPHKDIFERIPGPAGKARPIQKMVAAPLLDREGRAIGVVEVSRAGATPAEAGADFNARDTDNLAKTCKVFAPFIARTWVREGG